MPITLSRQCTTRHMKLRQRGADGIRIPFRRMRHIMCSDSTTIRACAQQPMPPLTLPLAALRSWLLLDWGRLLLYRIDQWLQPKPKSTGGGGRTPARAVGLALSGSGPKTNAIRFVSLSERYFHDVEKALSGYVLNVLSVFSSSVK